MTVRQRILVIGSPGAGKTTFSKALAKALKLPLIHLDQYSRIRNWVFLDREAWRKKVEELSKQEEWIMDGDYLDTLDIRFRRAEMVIFLDLPRWICTWRVFVRGILNAGDVRSDMPPNCPEEFSWKFLKFVKNSWKYSHKRRAKKYELLKALPVSTPLVIFKSKKQAHHFLKHIELK